MSCNRFKQDVLDKRIYSINFQPFLGDGVDLASATWDVPSGLTVSDTSVATPAAIAYFSGGSEGKEYEVSVTGFTNESIVRKFTQTFVIEIADTCD